jgi:hypothetical protein
VDNKRGFKRKTIVQTIQNKMDKWIKSIDDEVLRKEVKNDYIVTGGAIASMLLGENPNDYDVYFQTPEVVLNLVNYYISKVTKTDKVSRIFAEIKNSRVVVFIKSAGIIRSEDEDFKDYEYFEMTNGDNIESYLDKESFKTKTPFSVSMISSNAISLHGDVQIITRFIGRPDVIHENYDFVHVTNWYTEKDGLVLNEDALESILAKELKYVGSLYPICSMFRIKKFINRGWTITAGEMLKIAWDISKLDLNVMEVLYEQLIGVDASFFHELINILKKSSNKNINRTYLFETINRVFDGNDADEFHELIE